MTWTPHSNFAALTAGLLLALPAARADEILLDAGKLSGTLGEIDDSGHLSLRSPLSASPIRIDGAGIRKITFPAVQGDARHNGGMLQLANGDTLPCDILSLKNGSFDISTWYSGNASIPRASVSAVHFGIQQQQSILSDPGQPGDWRNNEGWTFEGDALVAKGTAKVSRDFKLPKSFRLKCHISWKNPGHSPPKLKMFFCEPAQAPAKGRADCYYMTFNSAGIEIKRQTPSAYPSIYQNASLLPGEFRNSEMDLEIRVDRQRGTIEPLINGDSKGIQADTPPAPEGNAISFQSMHSGFDFRISKLEILEWDSQGEHFRTEDRGDTTKDSMIYDKGQRAYGELIEIIPSGNDPKISFKSPSMTSEKSIPASVTSTIFLTHKDSPADDAPFLIRLRGGGKLHASLLASQQDSLTVSHPLAGKLTLQRAAVTSIERVPPPPAKP